MADYNESDHPRDEHGRFTSGESDASQKSRDAGAATARADSRDESLGSESGANLEHQGAADAHREAADAHRALADKYTAAGDHEKAEEHASIAADHDLMVGAHEVGAGRTIEYQNKVKATQEAARAAKVAAGKVAVEAPRTAPDGPKGPKKKDAAGHARRVALRAENDQRVASNVAQHDPALVPVWNKVKDKWNPRHQGFEERTKNFLEWAHDHPRDVADIQEKHADKQLKSSLGKWADKKTGGRAPKATASKRDKGLGTWASKKVSSESAEVPF